MAAMTTAMAIPCAWAGGKLREMQRQAARVSAGPAVAE
jgi:hypothetical protein